METISRRQLERRTGIARLESEEIGALLDALRAEVELSRRGRRRNDVLDLIGAMEERLAALLEVLDVPVGLSVEQTATRLSISEPTVRKWLRDGLLAAVPERKPLEVSQASVLGVEVVLNGV